jgi:hypothetical protein
MPASVEQLPDTHHVHASLVSLADHERTTMRASTQYKP